MPKTSNVAVPDWMARAVVAAMEQAAISGLCREGRVEIGAQKLRELNPEMDRSDAFVLARALDKSRTGVG